MKYVYLKSISKFAAPQEQTEMNITQTTKMIAIPGLEVVARENFSYNNLYVPLANFSIGTGSLSSPLNGYAFYFSVKQLPLQQIIEVS